MVRVVLSEVIVVAGWFWVLSTGAICDGDVADRESCWRVGVLRDVESLGGVLPGSVRVDGLLRAGGDWVAV